ncbi:MAG: hypothetical protein QM817_29615 [Archangium sp.]
MLLALVLAAACSVPSFEARPAVGTTVPVNPTFHLFGTSLYVLQVEDGLGASLSFTANRNATFLSVMVQAPDRTVVYLTLGNTRLGPWTVSAATAPFDRRAPTIELETERAASGCFNVGEGWGLGSDRPTASLWEIELTQGGRTKRRPLYRSTLELGTDCGDSIDLSQPLFVRARATFADGSLSDWSNTLELDRPTGPPGERARQFFLWGLSHVFAAAISVPGLVLMAGLLVAMLVWGVVGGLKAITAR